MVSFSFVYFSQCIIDAIVIILQISQKMFYCANLVKKRTYDLTVSQSAPNDAQEWRNP